MNDPFVFSDIDVADLANENKLYISGKNVDDIVESLELALLSLFKA